MKVGCMGRVEEDATKRDNNDDDDYDDYDCETNSLREVCIDHFCLYMNSMPSRERESNC